PAELQVVEVKRVDAAGFPTPMPFFLASEQEDRKWRLPTVLACDEFGVEVVKGPIPSYMIEERDGKMMIAVRLSQTKADPNSERAKRMQEAFYKNLTKSGKQPKKRTTTQIQTAPPGTPGAPPGTPGAPSFAPPGGVGAPGGSGFMGKGGRPSFRFPGGEDDE